MLDNNNAYKYETPYKVPFVITQYFTNVTITFQCGAIKIRCNIHHIKPHTADTNHENIDLKTSN